MWYEVWLDNINRPWLGLRTQNETDAKEFLTTSYGKYMYVFLYTYCSCGCILSINNVSVSHHDPSSCRAT
jgi:hypothetical protein